MHRLELRQMHVTERRLPDIGVRQVVHDHLGDVELFALLAGGTEQRREETDHRVRRSQRRKRGSSSSNRNTKATRLRSAASRGNAALRLNHHATPPTAPKRSAIPPTQPATNMDLWSRK